MRIGDGGRGGEWVLLSVPLCLCCATFYSVVLGCSVVLAEVDLC
ncbi:hypothetical protein [Rubritalea tangerina]